MDVLIRRNMKGELKKLPKDLGQSIIYVTPGYTETMAMADRIAVMDMGRL